MKRVSAPEACGSAREPAEPLSTYPVVSSHPLPKNRTEAG